MTIDTTVPGPASGSAGAATIGANTAANTVTAIGEGRILIPPAVHRDDVIDVRALLSHPMDTGFFRDADGHPIPEYFVNAVTVTYGGDEVARFEWTSGISRDPYVSFPLLASREAPIRVIWRDNKGGIYEQSVDVKFA